MSPSVLVRLRRLCLGLPDAHQVVAWGEPTFRVRNRLFAMYAAADNHHGAGRASVWIKSTPDNQDLLLRAHPTLLFKPPYVGPSGWIGVYLDVPKSWRLLPDLLAEGYALAAKARSRRRSRSQSSGSAQPTKAKASPRRASSKGPRRPTR